MTIPALDYGNDQPWMSHPDRPCLSPINDPTYIQDHADSFYPREKYYDQAAKLCVGCPVSTQCLQYALDNREEDGIWGGTTPKDRAIILRRMARDGAA
jgi:hypothetical protein